MNNGSRKNSLTNVIDNTNVKSKNESNLSMSSKVAIYRIGTETLTEIDEDSQEDIDEQKKKRNQASSLWRDSNSEKRKEYAKEYASKNRAKLTSIERKRQASKLKRTPEWLTDFDKLHMECLYQVAAMRTRESGQEWHVDHILPLQGKTVSGLHVPSNLRVIPAVENLRKYNTYGV
jgi:hypothetical protein